MPPQYSSISSRAVTPAGASTTPGLLTRPESGEPREHPRAPQPHARLVDASGDREAAEALALAAAVRREPGSALLHDVAHPEQRLDVLLERRTAEQADLRDIGRPVAWQAALALERVGRR